ncbi:hypothetical protein E2562_023579 [Oryza meyeriana var. granulata]|uniref:Uncharacterized protein n=1 Tax=Oryza meyeriana var. granulata TaxID=110450 RepID=A0A6G1E1R9_9ORYZ|nr:hypothetical protein E2562_023579 [Oryza meyeriana var. granulata]
MVPYVSVLGVEEPHEGRIKRAFLAQWEGIKYRRRRRAQALLLLSPLWVGVLASAWEAGGDDDDHAAVGEEAASTKHPYMSSSPFSDLVVVVLFVCAVVAAVLHQRVLVCARRSMHQRLHGWNKSSSMLRSVRLSLPP